MFAYRLVLWNCFEKGSMRRVLKSHLCVCVLGGWCVCESVRAHACVYAHMRVCVCVCVCSCVCRVQYQYIFIATCQVKYGMGHGVESIHNHTHAHMCCRRRMISSGGNTLTLPSMTLPAATGTRRLHKVCTFVHADPTLA